MTGELKDVKGYGVIQTQALGSCIALAAYNKENKYAALAHIMLPDYSPQKNKTEIFRYAGNAIDELEKKIEENNCKKEETIFFMVGAGNVLQREDDTICESNIKSVS
ncbi:MAG TPA: chemotaxis protein CheD, partial [bacterium]|nr:chemotaxis protein CheD [bacterium]